MLRIVCVVLRFEPHGADDAQQNGKAQAEKPGEIPHDRSFPYLGFQIAADRVYASSAIRKRDYQ
jgi:hypothetical protein